MTAKEIKQQIVNLNTTIEELDKQKRPLVSERFKLLDELKKRCQHKDLIEYSWNGGDYFENSEYYQHCRKCLGCAYEETGRPQNQSNSHFDKFDVLTGTAKLLNYTEYKTAKTKLDTLLEKVNKTCSQTAN